MDLTAGDSKRAKERITAFTKSSDLTGVIEFIYSGSRFKVFVPQENCFIMLALTAVRTPNPARAAPPGQPPSSARPAEPMGDDAKLFSRRQLLQRRVRINIEDVDRHGVALGSVLLGQGEARHDFGEDLLTSGMAKVDEWAVNRMTQMAAAKLMNLQEVRFSCTHRLSSACLHACLPAPHSILIK